MTLTQDLPLLQVSPGTTLELLIVAADGGSCAGIELGSGVLVRGWWDQSPLRPPRAYDVVTGTVADSDAVPDPSAPEALMLAGAPELTGRMTGRRADRLLRPLLHPRNEPLLGLHAPAIRFWERKPDRPSIAVVEPEGPITLTRTGSYLGCRFSWQKVMRELPCLDRRVAFDMDRHGKARVAGSRGDRLVVALTPPIDGHCHKVVEAILPRP